MINNSFLKWLKKENEKDKENMMPVALNAQLAISFLKDYLLGQDWYFSDPISEEQINTEIVFEILKKYSKEFKKELKQLRKKK